MLSADGGSQETETGRDTKEICGCWLPTVQALPKPWDLGTVTALVCRGEDMK